MYIQANVDAWVVLRKNQIAQEETSNVLHFKYVRKWNNEIIQEFFTIL
jgi:hypothetical protein